MQSGDKADAAVLSFILSCAVKEVNQGGKNKGKNPVKNHVVIRSKVVCFPSDITIS
jgi:hypothetical protein